jgi:serine/threonine-protein kinase
MVDFVQEGDVLVGKFRVKRVLGRGGMGVVVAAHHLQLDKPVALKLLLPAASEDPQAVNWFLREARAAARIQSDHIVQVSDVGTLDSGTPYMVMELLEGMDLAQILRAAGPLSISTAVDHLLQTCEGVAEAHRLGIVHRDLKPSNLFLTQRSDGSPLIKVLDFGISKATGSLASGSAVLTATAAFIGSPMYMSPEQVRSAKDVDARTDIWSLGVVLHELLTGAPVFKADSASAVMAMIAADPPVPVRRVRPDVPTEIEKVLLRALQKDRTQRWANVGELAAALAPFGSARGKASAEQAQKILQLAPPETPRTEATQLSSEPPPSTGSSWGHTAHRSQPRRTRTVVIAATAAVAAVTTLAGLVLRERSVPETNVERRLATAAQTAAAADRLDRGTATLPPGAAASSSQGNVVDVSRPTSSRASALPGLTPSKFDAPVAPPPALGVAARASAKPAPRASLNRDAGATPASSGPPVEPTSSVFDHRTF